MRHVTSLSDFPPPSSPPICEHIRTTTINSDHKDHGETPFPCEILMHIMSYADLLSWNVAINGAGLMCSIVQKVVHSRVLSCIKRFWPEETVADLFFELLQSHGVIFGDVPFRILFGRYVNASRMDIAAPASRSRGLQALILRTGYQPVTPDTTRLYGCAALWLFYHPRVRGSQHNLICH